jgi:hypothetical protein
VKELKVGEVKGQGGKGTGEKEREGKGEERGGNRKGAGKGGGEGGRVWKDKGSRDGNWFLHYASLVSSPASPRSIGEHALIS